MVSVAAWLRSTSWYQRRLSMSGRVVHFEIPADDLNRARAFYESAFGWNLMSVPEMEYTMVNTTPSDDQGRPTEPGSINGGMFLRQDPLTTPVVTIDVDDIDKAMETVGSLGGSTGRPRQAVGDMGFAAYFKDSEGNLIGLWQNA
jgi:predicted enzyme related to lactoylglutathione lyase